MNPIQSYINNPKVFNYLFFLNYIYLKRNLKTQKKYMLIKLYHYIHNIFEKDIINCINKHYFMLNCFFQFYINLILISF